MSDGDSLRGNLHAIEHLLGQLFVIAIEGAESPQDWLLTNARQIEAKIMRPNTLNDEEKDAANGTVRRVMEIASMHFEASGRGPMINLR
jgi:hypothetical protein